jgi:hypothetical protein
MKPQRLALIHFILFVVLILTGIIVKRVFGHPEYMVFFHLPAAVFLVLTGMALKQGRARDYEREIESIRSRQSSP